MKRRSFITALASLALLPSLLSAASIDHLNTVEYKPGVIKQALANGKTVFVDYYTTWCTTCARQARIIGGFRQDNPAYDQNIMFVQVDWDQYANHEVSTSRNIPRRSTLVMLKGDKELGRLVADTNPRNIKALLDSGL